MDRAWLEPVELRCLRCDTRYPVAEMPVGCSACLSQGQPSSVVPVWDLAEETRDQLRRAWIEREPGLWSYPELLPVASEARVSMQEGATPLVDLPRVSEEAGGVHVLLKDERRNPTGSFKDRFFSVAMSRAGEAGAQTVVTASSGNGGVSAAAYAARAGLRCVVITTPEISLPWRAAIETYGGTLLATGTSSERWELMRLAVEELGWYPLTNFIDPPVGSNWYGVEGYKSIAYEIARELDWRVPDWVAVPTSRGDGLLGIWRGFRELYTIGMTDRLPRIAAVERFPSIARAIEQDLPVPPDIEGGPALASSIGNHRATFQSVYAVQDSDGVALPCDDEALLDFVRTAGRDGVFLELSSAAGLVGAAQLVERGLAAPGDMVVAVATSSGMNDPATIAGTPAPLEPIRPNLDSLRRIGLG